MTPAGKSHGPSRALLGTLLTAVSTLTIGCERPAATPAGGLARYDLSGAPSLRVTLPAELREVSGLAVDSTGRLFAHGDEEGRVFEIEPSTGKVLKSFALAPGATQMDLGKKPKDGVVAGDFEDLAIAGGRFFMVTSGGVLLEFGEGEDGTQVPFTVHPTGLGETCEVEGLAHDPASQSLLLLCKEMREESQRDRLEIFGWPLRDQRLEERPRSVTTFSALAPVTGAKEFNGSALAIVPGGRSLAIVAGPQRLFAEVAPDGKPLGGGALQREGLPQPEGMAFLPDGTLLISSEGGKGEATVSAYRPQ